MNTRLACCVVVCLCTYTLQHICMDAYFILKPPEKHTLQSAGFGFSRRNSFHCLPLLLSKTFGRVLKSFVKPRLFIVFS